MALSMLYCEAVSGKFSIPASLSAKKEDAMIKGQKPEIDEILKPFVRLVKMNAPESRVKNTMKMKKVPTSRYQEVGDYVKNTEAWEPVTRSQICTFFFKQSCALTECKTN